MSRYHARNAARCSRARSSTPSQKGRHRCCQKRQPFRPNYLSCSSSFTVLTPIDSYETVPPRALTTASAEIVNPFLQHRRTRLILVVRSRQRTFLDPTYTYARLYEREERSIKVFGKRETDRSRNRKSRPQQVRW